MWRRVRLGLVWVVSAVVALGLVASGVDRLRLTPGVVTQFEAFGYSLLFARAVGLFEVIGAFSLLIPRVATWSAAALSCLMLGAIASHLMSGYGSPFHAARTLAFLLCIIALRKWPQRSIVRDPGDTDPPEHSL